MQTQHISCRMISLEAILLTAPVKLNLLMKVTRPLISFHLSTASS